MLKKERRIKMSNDRTTQVSSSQQDPEREQRIFTFKATQLIWLLFGILEALIALRIGLKLIGANPDSLIVALIYGFTYLFLFPFAGLIGSPTSGNMVLELSSMFAMLIYGLIAWVIERIVWLIFYRPHGSVVGTTQTTTSEHHTTP
jgi:YGGT family